jgi:hypothetical protein
MLETSYESPLEKMRKEDWATLTSEEKAFCINYERLLFRSEVPDFLMISKMTRLYEKYPDINIVACIPRKEANTDLCKEQRKTIATTYEGTTTYE